MPKQWALVILVGYAILLLVLSLITIRGFHPVGTSFDDKINHFGAYFVLTLLIFNYLKTLNRSYAVLYALFIATTYGVLMEYLQKYLTSERMFDYYDIVANFFGAFIAGIFIVFFRKLKLK